MKGNGKDPGPFFYLFRFCYVLSVKIISGFDSFVSEYEKQLNAD